MPRSKACSICGALMACAFVEKMSEVQRVRFLSPILDGEFRKALETLALSHDTAKKAFVSINFAGSGKACNVRCRLCRRESHPGRRAIGWCWTRTREGRAICKVGLLSRIRRMRTGKTCAWLSSPVGPSPSRWTSTPPCTCRVPWSSPSCSPLSGPSPTRVGSVVRIKIGPCSRMPFRERVPLRGGLGPRARPNRHVVWLMS